MEDNKLNSIINNFTELEKKLSNLNEKDFSNYAKLSKEYSDLKPLVQKINQYNKLKKELLGVEEILELDDDDLKREALEEKEILSQKISSVGNKNYVDSQRRVR